MDSVGIACTLLLIPIGAYFVHLYVPIIRAFFKEM